MKVKVKLLQSNTDLDIKITCYLTVDKITCMQSINDHSKSNSSQILAHAYQSPHKDLTFTLQCLAGTRENLLLGNLPAHPITDVQLEGKQPRLTLNPIMWPCTLRKLAQRNDSTDLLMMSALSYISSSVMHSGGANLMMSPWVGLASRPLSLNFIHIFQAS